MVPSAPPRTPPLRHRFRRPLQGDLDCFNAFVADVCAGASGNPPEGSPMFADGLRAAVVTDAIVKFAECGYWMVVSA